MTAGRRRASRAAAAGVALLGACLVVCRPAGETGTAADDAAAAPPAVQTPRTQREGSSAPGAGAGASDPSGAQSGAGGGAAGAAGTPAAPPAVRRLVPRVVASYPHDPGSYTQGLELAGGVLYESAGQYGASSVRQVDVETGEVLLRRHLPRDLFAEGLTLVPAAARRPPRLVQLTWREGLALVWDPSDLEPLRQHLYRGEGWGLCFDAGGPEGPRLVMSDGSSYLTFRHPETFEVIGGVAVTLGGAPVGGLNELECVGGSVWANVYPTDEIVEIDLAMGRVTATVDGSGLLAPAAAPAGGVLNGIAHDPVDGTFLLTGKYWPRLFRVELVER